MNINLVSICRSVGAIAQVCVNLIALSVAILTWSELWQNLSLDPVHWWICALTDMQYNLSPLSLFP
jgi:hypothetical protein